MVIGDIPGFTPQIGRLVCMLNYVRQTTFSAVADLSVDQLDYQHDSQSNTIGALLAHIAATEAGYQAVTFDGRDLSEAEKAEWRAALELGDRGRSGVRGQDLAYYVKKLEQVHDRTLAELGRRGDQWLDEATSGSGGQPVNNYFKWFHVLSHEVNHRGQIRWLRTRATKRR
jgi:uncharacterized damage-inducible protein DinB